jgi:hypothetical protein
MAQILSSRASAGGEGEPLIDPAAHGGTHCCGNRDLSISIVQHNRSIGQQGPTVHSAAARRRKRARRARSRCSSPRPFLTTIPLHPPFAALRTAAAPAGRRPTVRVCAAKQLKDRTTVKSGAADSGSGEHGRHSMAAWLIWNLKLARGLFHTQQRVLFGSLDGVEPHALSRLYPNAAAVASPNTNSCHPAHQQLNQTTSAPWAWPPSAPASPPTSSCCGASTRCLRRVRGCRRGPGGCWAPPR